MTGCRPLCAVCGRRLALTSCTACGRVVCDECSVEVKPGIRACVDCAGRRGEVEERAAAVRARLASVTRSVLGRPAGV